LLLAGYRCRRRRPPSSFPPRDATCDDSQFPLRTPRREVPSGGAGGGAASCGMPGAPRRRLISPEMAPRYEHTLPSTTTKKGGARISKSGCADSMAAVAFASEAALFVVHPLSSSLLLLRLPCPSKGEARNFFNLVREQGHLRDYAIYSLPLILLGRRRTQFGVPESLPPAFLAPLCARTSAPNGPWRW